MQAVIIILTVLVAILLIIVVLIQKSKGGGLASNFSGSNQIMGVRRTTDFIEKTTWTLACAVAVLSIISVLITPRQSIVGSRVKSQAPAETQAPEFPAPVQDLPEGTMLPDQAPEVPVEEVVE